MCSSDLVLPRLKQFTLVGVFEAGHYEYDASLAFIHMDDAEKLFRLSGPTGLRLRIQDMQRAPEVAADLSATLKGDLYLRDWSQQNRNWFAAVQTEKRMMFIILTLIIAVAAFNLVSTLVMTVTDKQADIAMYEAKQAGRDDIRFFDPSMQRMVNERVLMENALRNAAIDDEFILHYQPQWYRDGSLAGFEALVRWNHPTRGLLEPAEFIPLAEETGVILSLGRWVLEHACWQIAQWSASNPGIRVAVNISAAQLRNPEFVDEVRQALRHHATSPDCLSLELTESMLIHDLHLTIRTMDELKAMGVRIALDDFGTGYSSLSLLQILPLDYLKIDSSFVHRMEKGLRESRMVQSIVSIAKNLELDIIAEGVETEKQQALLETFGCDEFQGFLRGRSMPASEASRLLHLH